MAGVLEQIQAGPKQGWLTVAHSTKRDGITMRLFCAVIPTDQVEAALGSIFLHPLPLFAGMTSARRDRSATRQEASGETFQPLGCEGVDG